MVSSIKYSEWEMVRVLKPCSLGRVWHGRLPQVGDCGVIVHINEDKNATEPWTIYIVENTEFKDSGDADLIWLAEFSAGEIERY